MVRLPPLAASEMVRLDTGARFPPASSIRTTGWVVKALPEGPAVGLCANTNWVPVPGPEGVKLLLVAVTLFVPMVIDAVMVYDVPTVPTKVHDAT